MSSAEPTAVAPVEPTLGTVPAPRSAPDPEVRPRRHDGFFWDVTAAAWRRSLAR